jgi:mono/diheme cytochrome c family protein
MKAVLLLLLVPAFATAQNLQDVLKQGADVFAKTCGSGYCHGDQGAGGGAPRIAARGFDQSFIANTVARGIPNTSMPPFTGTLSRTDLSAVVAYVARLNGIANLTIDSSPVPTATPSAALSPAAVRGRELFSDAVRGFARCSTCHEVNSIGIPVAAPIGKVPDTAAQLKSLATPRVSTVTASGETMPALVLANKSQSVLFYDLTTPPPVLRTQTPGSIQVRDGSNWRHSTVIGTYKDDELMTILEYLRAVVNR